MVEILKTATSVATPLAFLGLAVAFAYFAYNRRLRHNEKQLESLPEDERARITDEYLTRYGIDGKKLRLADKLALIRDEMDKRHQRSQSYLIVSAVVFVICFGLAVFAYVRTSQASNESDTVDGATEPQGPRQISRASSPRGDLVQSISFLSGKSQEYPGMADAIPLVADIPDRGRGQFVCSDTVTSELRNPWITIRGLRTEFDMADVHVFLFPPRGRMEPQLHATTQNIVEGEAKLKFTGTLPPEGVVFVVVWVDEPPSEPDWSHLSIWVE